MPGPVDHQKLREVFLGACDLDGAARRAFLERACGADQALRAAVDELLRNDLPDDELDLAPAAPAEPTRIGPFRVLELLGEGGMGRVYRAEQTRPRRAVALKVLRVAVATEDLRRRFANEADVLAKLQHPGIAQVFEFGTDDQLGEPVPFLAMELVDGVALLEHAERERLGRRARVELFARICEAVAHAHAAGVIHRDLKPANILVAGDQPKVLDFGISRVADLEQSFHTMTGQFVGTVGYMSPEQLAGDPGALGVRSDVYSLGVVLYELLVGRKPLLLDGLPIAAVAQTVRDVDPPALGALDPQLRGDLEVIAGKCLEKEPVRRYADAGELAADLRRHLADQPIQARPTTAFYQVRKFARRHRVAVIGTAAFVLALVGGIVTTTIFALQAGEQRDHAMRTGYRAVIAAVDGTLDRDPNRARRYLQSVPEEQRGWEWRRHQARLDEGPLWPGAAHVIARAGGLLAAVRDGDVVEVRDPESGRTLASVRPGFVPEGLPSLAPTGDLLALRDPTTRSVAVFALDGRLLARLPFPGDGPAPRLCWSGDGSQLLLYGEGLVAHSYAARSGALRCRIDQRPKFATFLPGGDRILCYLRQQLFEVEAATGRELRRRAVGTSHMPPVLSARGDAIVCGNLRAFELFDDFDGAPARFTGHSEMVTAGAFSPDARLLATSGESGGDGTTRILDLRTRDLRVVRLGGGHRSMAFARDGAVLAAGGGAGLRVDVVERGGQLVLRGHESFVTEVAYSPDGTMLASTGWDGQVLLWDALSGEMLASMSWERSGWGAGVAFSADGQRVLAVLPAVEGVCFEWDVATAQLVATHDQAEYLRRARPGARRVPMLQHAHLAELRTASGRLRRSGEGCEVRPLEAGDHAPVVLPLESFSAAAVSADGGVLAIGNEQGRVQLWDVRAGFDAAQLIGELRSSGGQLHALAFDAAGERLAAGTDQSVIDLWDLRTRTQVAELAGHEGYVHAVAFSPDGTQLASGSGDATVRLWNTRSFRERLVLHHQAVAERDRQAPWVEALLAAGTPREAAATIRGSDRSPAQKRAALRVLLRRTR